MNKSQYNAFSYWQYYYFADLLNLYEIFLQNIYTFKDRSDINKTLLFTKFCVLIYNTSSKERCKYINEKSDNIEDLYWDYYFKRNIF